MADPADTADDTLTAALRRAYLAMGFGSDDPVRALFEQAAGEPAVDAQTEPGVAAETGAGETGAAWQVVDLVGGGRYRSRDLAADDLFGAIPGHWEVTRVEPVDLKRSGDAVVVTGRIFCRPPGGSWEQMALPFAHIWTFARGRLVKVRCYLEGIELRRLERLSPAG